MEMTEELIVKLEGITEKKIKVDSIHVLNSVFKIVETNPLTRNQKERLIYQISRIILNTIISSQFLNHIFLLLERKTTDDLRDFLVHCLIESSEHKDSSRFLIELLKGNNVEIKETIFYYHIGWPLRHVYQTKELKSSFIDYINSDAFQQTFEAKCKENGRFSKLFAFPSQYSNCFNVSKFTVEPFSKYSKAYLSRLTSKGRIESIQAIEDDNLKLELIYRYYHSYLEPLYRTKFIKTINKEFPHLELSKKYSF